MASSIQEHIAALREEVEREYSERLAAIAALEANLLGTSAANGVASTHGAADPSAPITGMFGNIIRVRRALSKTDFKTIRELTKITGLDEFSVRNSLKSKTLSREIEREKEGGGPFAYRLKSTEIAASKTKASRGGSQPSVATLIRNVLSSEPKGLTPTELTDRVVKLNKTSAVNPRNPVYARLCKLKQEGEVSFDATTKLYKLVKSK